MPTKAGKKKAAEGPLTVGPISKEYLRGFLSSEAFSSALGLTLRKVIENKRELGFTILKDANSDYTYISRPQGGETDDATLFNPVYEKERLERKFRGKTFFVLGTLHFHPHWATKVISPSITMEGSCDLVSTTSIRKLNTLDQGEKPHLSKGGGPDWNFDIPSIEMIALKKGSGIDLLFYQEPLWDTKYKPYSPMGFAVHLRSVLHDELGREPKNQEDVITSLKKYRYKAMLVHTSESGQLTEKDSSLVARTFAFRPHRLSLNRIINYTEKQIEAMELLRLEEEWDEEFQ